MSGSEKPESRIIGLARYALSSPVICWTAFTACSLAILYANFRPSPPPDIFENSDKFGHILSYAALTFSGRYALRNVSSKLFWPGFLLLGIAMELLQGATRPLRFFSIEDSYANLAGVGVAFIAYLVVRGMKLSLVPSKS